MNDEFFMQRALELARRAEGWTSPNPLVGAVIVKDGQIIGEGFHKKAGTPHAEVHALRQAGSAARGATVYVTLEPCCHYGRTPPCTEALIGIGVAKVVVAIRDPNPKVAGGGIRQLREAGIQVVTGVLEQEAQVLNEVFFKQITARIPFVSVKSALTLDGKTATKTGSSQWITGPHAREMAHRLRHRYDAVMVGIGTVLADDPQLTVRIPGERLKNPIRVVIDSSLSIPCNARVLDPGEAPTLIYTARAEPEKASQLRKQGIQVIECPGQDNRVDLRKVLENLYLKGITGVLVEGGSELNGTLLDQKLIDKIYLFFAPKLVGSSAAPPAFGGNGVANISEAIRVKNVTFENLGDDYLVIGYPRYGSEQ